MVVAVALRLVSVVLFLSITLVSVAYIKLFRRYRIPSFCCCCRHPDDLELGPSGARVADGPDLKAEPTNKDSVRRIKSEEIDSLSANFTSSTVIGEGGFSTVYLARLPDSSSLAALKVSRSSERLHRAFRQELDVLLHVNHPHIVRLLGYCDDRDEGVLAFEYISNGTLHDMLHGSTAVLPWSKRASIAFQLAMALDYLHEGCDLQIVHGDIKSSNVLIDHCLNSKLCDFGFARMGFSATVTRSTNPMMGSPGYVDPHHLRTGLVSKKNDVYGFGVLVLELITGLEAFCSEQQQMLTAVMGPLLRDTDGRRVGEFIDSKLGGVYNAEEVLAMAGIAVQCIGEHPSLRPSMAEVLRIMREKIPSSISVVDLIPNTKPNM